MVEKTVTLKVQNIVYLIECLLLRLVCTGASISVCMRSICNKGNCDHPQGSGGVDTGAKDGCKVPPYPSPKPITVIAVMFPFESYFYNFVKDFLDQNSLTDFGGRYQILLLL